MLIGRFNTLETTVWNLLEPAIGREGFRLVQVRFLESAGRTLQIMIDHLESDKVISVDDCALVSNHVSVLLDVDDPIPGHYNLEVSSPGMDRPLTSIEDLKAHIGYEIRLTADPIGGRKHFRGKLQAVLEHALNVNVDKVDVVIPFAAVHHVKLVINDSLVKAAMRGLEPEIEPQAEFKPKTDTKPKTNAKAKPKTKAKNSH
ncbi:MAG: ribosome maturation factor RimP [Alphaproteobacteria bacterium]|nr:ribosome maturation factor RimP [Alphaproteobacteria bacterium]